jgi:beta-glucuronidase
LLVATAVLLSVSGVARAASDSTPGPIVITGADRRVATSLDGEWAAIVDPYFSGLFSFHHEEKANGWFLNQKAKPGDTGPTEYDFSTAPKLKVPGDWNTQRDSLFFYEGPIWYERDFTYQAREIPGFICTLARPITIRISG